MVLRGDFLGVPLLNLFVNLNRFQYGRAGIGRDFGIQCNSGSSWLIAALACTVSKEVAGVIGPRLS